MNENEDLSKNIKKLLALLKKMMTQDGGQLKGGVPPELQQILSDSKNVNLNLCILAFLPLHPDEFDDMEDALVDGMMDEEKAFAERESLNFEITADDKDFLKKYGIKF